jgi:hypothetical protein
MDEKTAWETIKKVQTDKRCFNETWALKYAASQGFLEGLRAGRIEMREEAAKKVPCADCSKLIYALPIEEETTVDRWNMGI